MIACFTIRHEHAKKLKSQLTAARAVIAVFVYPFAPMTPQQREAWAKWLQVTGDA